MSQSCTGGSGGLHGSTGNPPRVCTPRGGCAPSDFAGRVDHHHASHKIWSRHNFLGVSTNAAAEVWAFWMFFTASAFAFPAFRKLFSIVAFPASRTLLSTASVAFLASITDFSAIATAGVRTTSRWSYAARVPSTSS